MQVEKKGHAGNIVTAYVGGNMEHGLLHATHSQLLVLLLRIYTVAGGEGAAPAVSQQGLELSYIKQGLKLG